MVNIQKKQVEDFFKNLWFAITIHMDKKKHEFYNAMLDFQNKDEAFEKLKKRICKIKNYQLTEEDRRLTCDWFDAHSRIKTAKKALDKN